MPTSGTPILKSDMDALATLANANLLPLVNAQVDEGTWPMNEYDVNYWEYPEVTQPDYEFPPYNSASFPPGNLFSSSISYITYSGHFYPVHNTCSWNTQINRIKADYYTIMNQDMTLLNDSILSGPWVVGVSDKDVFPSIGCGGYSVAYPSQSLDGNGELFGTLGLIGGAEPVGGYFSGGPNTITSYPNQTAYKSVQFSYALNDALNGLEINCGRRVDFPYAGYIDKYDLYYSASMAGIWNCQLFWQVEWTGGGAPPVHPPLVSSFGTASAYPSTGVTWETSGSNNISTSALIANINLPIVQGNGSINFTASAPPTGYSIIQGPVICSRMIYDTNSDPQPIQAIHPTSNTMTISAPDMPDDESDFIVNGNYSVAFWSITDKNVKGVWSAFTLPVPAINCYVDQDLPNYVGSLAPSLFTNTPVVVSPNLEAINIALETETIGDLNVTFIDNYPNSNSYFGQWDNSLPILASSTRQQALLQNGERMLYFSGSVVSESFFSGSIAVDLGPKYNLIEQSCQAQPSQWMTLASGSPMPILWGEWGNPNQSYDIYGNVIMASGSTNNYNLAYPSNTTAIKIKLRNVSPLNSTTPWRLYDGGKLNNNSMSIMVSKTYMPPPYDFISKTNEADIPPMGGRNYLSDSSGFNYSIKNGNAFPVSFDLLVETDWGDVPLELEFIPDAYECFSYVLDGSPGNSFTTFYSIPSLYPTYTGLKRIPAQGYCIYKVRATRLPVQNNYGISITPSTGNQINITLGQYRQLPDKTYLFAPFTSQGLVTGAGDEIPGADDEDSGAGGDISSIFTLTIQPNQRDTGDVDCWLPVIHGQPLVYKSDTPCLVEAWANWQPIWFASAYSFPAQGFYINDENNYIPNFNPRTFQFCNSFTNFFDPRQTNYPDPYGIDVYGDSAGTHVQYPLSIALYKDLQNCLSLLS